KGLMIAVINFIEFYSVCQSSNLFTANGDGSSAGSVIAEAMPTLLISFKSKGYIIFWMRFTSLPQRPQFARTLLVRHLSSEHKKRAWRPFAHSDKLGMEHYTLIKARTFSSSISAAEP